MEEVNQSGVKETKVEDLSSFVLAAAYNRGLDADKYDFVKPIHLFDNSYRINCHSKGKILDSYFVRYHKGEGISVSYPNLPQALEEI